MKTEYAIIAAVVIIGVLFAVSSLLGMTKMQTTTTSSSSTSSTSPITSTSSTLTTTTTYRTTTSSSTTTTSSTTSTTLVFDPKATVDITADKPLYYSNQLMTFTVSVNSSDNLSNAKVSLRGIMAGYYRIDEDNIVNLSKGVNTPSFQYRAPKCYGCAQIRPGKYNVSVEIIYGDKVVAKDIVRIELKQ